MLIAPARLTRLARLASLVSVAIPAEVEAGACSNLQEANRQPRPMGHLQESAQQRGGRAHTVGLAPTPDQATDLRPVLAQRFAKEWPRHRSIAIAADRWIVMLQLGQPALEDDPMHRAHQ